MHLPPTHPAGDPAATATPAVGDTVDHVLIEGQMLPVCNSLGQRIAPSDEGVRNFWSWFGSSRLVDDQGRPLVLYHGSASADVEAFDLSKAGSQKSSDWGPGLYLATSFGTADHYRQESLRKYDPLADALWSQMEELEKQATWHQGSPTYPPGHQDLLVAWRARRAIAGAGGGGMVYPLYVRLERPLVVSSSRYADPFAARDAADRGRDGVQVIFEDGSIDEALVFDPRQVKSATDNSGSFSPSSSSIRD